MQARQCGQLHGTVACLGASRGGMLPRFTLLVGCRSSRIPGPAAERRQGSGAAVPVTARRHSLLAQAKRCTAATPVVAAAEDELDAVVAIISGVKIRRQQLTLPGTLQLALGLADRRDDASLDSRFEQGLAKLQPYDNPGDRWLLVQCGEWTWHPLGYTGSARALMQVWQVTERLHQFYLHALDPAGNPTGTVYVTGSEMESYSSRYRTRWFVKSAQALFGSRNRMRLLHLKDHLLGDADLKAARV